MLTGLDWMILTIIGSFQVLKFLHHQEGKQQQRMQDFLRLLVGDVEHLAPITHMTPWTMNIISTISDKSMTQMTGTPYTIFRKQVISVTSRTWSIRLHRRYVNLDIGLRILFSSAPSTQNRVALRLHLTLMVEQPEYVGVISPNSGVKVAINDPRIYAFPEDDGIAASPGFATSIGITKTSISRLDYPYGDCISEHASYYQPEKYDFSQRSCTKMCLQKNLQSECSCVTDLLVNDTLCQFNIDKQVNCRKRIFKAFLKNKLKCDCTNPCKEIVFKPRISVSRWPAARFEGHLYDRLSVINRKAARILTNGAQSRNNLVRLSVFFEELNFEQVTESPLITVESLFGGVGGLLGLYVGMSFISIIEILVFISELIRSFCCPGSYSSNKTKVSGR